ncbi:FAD binding domain-containing protein [Chloroflexota bacterium]
MKPAPFKYYAPTSVEEALSHLAEHGYDAKVLAGGQSLIPTMNFRLAQPAILVDLNRISELFYINPDKNGGLSIGAMTRESQVEHDPSVAERAPLLTETMPYIAHEQIRHRGTFGGCLAHADPAAELPAVAVALMANMKVRGQSGERWVPADEFFLSLFTTVLMPDELLVEVAIPAMPVRTGWSFQEVARRHGDYALVGIAATVTLDKKNQCQDARLVYVSVGDRPENARQATEALKGQPLTLEVIEAAAETAATVDTEPGQDIHASAEFRRHLVKVLTRRALTQAAERARGG